MLTTPSHIKVRLLHSEFGDVFRDIQGIKLTGYGLCFPPRFLCQQSYKILKKCILILSNLFCQSPACVNEGRYHIFITSYQKSTQNYKVLLELPTHPDKFSLDDHEHCLYGGYDLMNHSCQLYIICEYVGGSLGTWKYVFYFPLLS